MTLTTTRIHTSLALLALMAIWGDAPVCAYDGYTYQCFFYTYEACEDAIPEGGNQRCVPNPY